MKRFLYCLLLLCAGLCAAATAASCPPLSKNLEWAAACFVGTGTQRRVKPQYMRNIRVEKSGVATILIGRPRELLAVDRRGRVVIPNIYHTGDFDYPSAPDNLGRFGVASRDAEGGPVFKCGYFDTVKFKVVIPAAYDNCRSFQDGEALVCNDCVNYCTEVDCQNSVFLGGNGFTLDRHNKVLRAGPEANLDNVCGARGRAKVDRSQGTPRLRCEPPA